jgi:hypothetical protein
MNYSILIMTSKVFVIYNKLPEHVIKFILYYDLQRCHE